MTTLDLFNFIRRLADAFAILFAFAAGYLIYMLADQRSVPYSFAQFLLLGAFAALIFLTVFHWAKLYEREASLLNVVETRSLLVCWVFGSLLLLGATFYLRFLDLSRLMTTTALFLSLLMLLVERSIIFHLGVAMLASGRPYRSAVIFGAGVVGRHLYKRICHSPALGLSVKGFLDDDPKLWGRALEIKEVSRKVPNGNVVLGGAHNLEELKKRGVQEVFIAMPSATYQRNLEIANECRKLGLKVSVVPPTYGHLMYTLEVKELGGIPVIQEKEMKPSVFYPFLKRTADIVLSVLAVVVLAPLIALIALMIRMDSPGPIIFRQRRVGLRGREFDFYKFRSMYVNANPYGLTPKSSSDARITRLGRWLRRSSLDELPQFFNVLKGDMSIVGPRPEMPFIVATYNEEQRERLKVKPGITGVWQISAVRGEPIHSNMEYDLFYIEHRSMLLDLVIIFKTVITAARGIGAF